MWYKKQKKKLDIAQQGKTTADKNNSNYINILRHLELLNSILENQIKNSIKLIMPCEQVDFTSLLEQNSEFSNIVTIWKSIQTVAVSLYAIYKQFENAIKTALFEIIS